MSKSIVKKLKQLGENQEAFHADLYNAAAERIEELEKELEYQKRATRNMIRLSELLEEENK